VYALLQKKIEPPRQARNIFGLLIQLAQTSNPIQYQLPAEVRSHFKGGQWAHFAPSSKDMFELIWCSWCLSSYDRIERRLRQRRCHPPPKDRVRSSSPVLPPSIDRLSWLHLPFSLSQSSWFRRRPRCLPSQRLERQPRPLLRMRRRPRSGEGSERGQTHPSSGLGRC
jgi:hypothetical protein